MNKNLYQKNHPAEFWKLPYQINDKVEWGDICKSASSYLPVEAQNENIEKILQNTLGEEQFGKDQWKLSKTRRLFYHIKPFIPKRIQKVIRGIHGNKNIQNYERKLNWPIEDRYITFQKALIKNILVETGIKNLPYIHFWPKGREFAFILTHDVETAEGLGFIGKIARIEKRYGFRSSFNIIPEKYPIDINLISKLKDDGFEIGIHGLKHDGKLYKSEKEFSKRIESINNYIKKYKASGFRSPLMHRNPELLQLLDCNYDASFFDTDLFEGISGGCMSIWPFFMGKLIELPYTLVQDHTLLMTLRNKNPEIWLDKIQFIRNNFGMALLNSHPDYLMLSNNLDIYEDFLRKMSQVRELFWHALPEEVAKWWQLRNKAVLNYDDIDVKINPIIPDAKLGKIRLFRNDLKIDPSVSKDRKVSSVI